MLRDDKAADALNYGLYVAKPAANGLGIEYTFSNGKDYAKKTFQFSKSGYLSQIETEVTINGVPHRPLDPVARRFWRCHSSESQR